MPLDPLGHIKLSCFDIEKSKTFYKELFVQLKYSLLEEGETSAGWASPEGLGFWIAQAKDKKSTHKFGAPGIHHLCFVVKSESEVDKIYEWLEKKNVRVFDPPQHYPEYTEKYYAIFFADPNGIKLEIAYY